MGLLDVFSMLIWEQGRNIRMHIEKNTKDKIARNPLGLTCVENNVLFRRNMMLPPYNLNKRYVDKKKYIYIFIELNFLSFSKLIEKIWNINNIFLDIEEFVEMTFLKWGYAMSNDVQIASTIDWTMTFCDN